MGIYGSMVSRSMDLGKNLTSTSFMTLGKSPHLFVLVSLSSKSSNYTSICRVILRISEFMYAKYIAEHVANCTCFNR